jgi:uncharacterized protein YbjT (DUF2867 family)
VTGLNETEQSMNPSLLVTGGTGTLGRRVLPRLQAAGCTMRVLSRKPQEPAHGIEYVAGDLLSGEGIESAISGAEVVLHLAGGPKGDDKATHNLATAARKAGVRHLILISVIAADKVPVGYFRAKLGAERALIESGVPYTILRAAQFHDLVFTVAQKMSKMPVLPIPGAIRFQPVDTGEVAERLVELTLAGPVGRVPDLAGPAVHPLGDLVRGYLQAHGKHRAFLPIHLPGKAGKVYRAGANLNLDTATSGKRTWEEFLAERTSAHASIPS